MWTKLNPPTMNEHLSGLHDPPPCIKEILRMFRPSGFKTSFALLEDSQALAPAPAPAPGPPTQEQQQPLLTTSEGNPSPE